LSKVGILVIFFAPFPGFVMHPANIVQKLAQQENILLPALPYKSKISRISSMGTHIPSIQIHGIRMGQAKGLPDIVCGNDGEIKEPRWKSS